MATTTRGHVEDHTRWRDKRSEIGSKTEARTGGEALSRDGHGMREKRGILMARYPSCKWRPSSYALDDDGPLAIQLVGIAGVGFLLAVL